MRVAGPCVTVQNDVLIFIRQLAAALITLGLMLGALVVAQVTYGLRPLAMVRARLMDVRLGHGTRLDAHGPSEIAPLIEELNGLLDERDEMVAKARAEAGNLAHALKTPIAVIRNEARGLPERSRRHSHSRSGQNDPRCRASSCERARPGRKAYSSQPAL